MINEEKKYKCRTCKELIPSSGFTPSKIRRHDFVCRKCFRVYTNARYKPKTDKIRRTREEIEEAKQSVNPESNLFKDLYQKMEELKKELSNPIDKGESFCLYCDRHSTKTDVTNPDKPNRMCDRHFSIYCLTLYKPYMDCHNRFRSLNSSEENILKQLGVL